MYKIHKAALEIRTSDNQGWENFCIQLPVVQVDLGQEETERKKRDIEGEEGEQEEAEDLFADFDISFEDDDDEDDDTFSAIRSGAGLGVSMDPSVLFYPDQYCPLVESMPQACFEVSLLEMFAKKGEYGPETDELIENLDQATILEAINTLDTRYDYVCCLFC